MRRTGFTLVELLCALAVAAILLAAAAPLYSALRAQSLQTSARDQLLSALNLARHTAVMRQRPVSVCGRAPAGILCGNGEAGWRHGWLAFIDPNRDERCADADGDRRCDADAGELLRVGAAPPHPVSIRGNHFVGRAIRFAPSGYAPWNQGTFSVCSPEAKPRYIVISPSGRIRTGAPGSSAGCSD